MADLPNGPDGRPQYGERIPGYVPPAAGQPASGGNGAGSGIPQYGSAPAATPRPGETYNPYGPGYQPYTPAPSTRTNTMAIIAFIMSFLVALVGIILGHIALSQIKKSGEGGRGWAIAALIIGYLSIVINIVLAIVIINLYNTNPAELNQWFPGLGDALDS